MLRDLLSSRWLQFGLVFFVLVIGGSLLYSWHTLRTTESDLERHDQLAQGIKQNETHPAETVNVPTETETPGFVNTPDENTDTLVPEGTEALPNETDDLVDAFLPDDMVSEEETAEEVSVSPYGFGPYPELPVGWPADKLWPAISAEHELMTRVQVKLAHQGVNVTGAITENGIVYPMIQGTVYIQWGETNGRSYIRRMTGPPETTDRINAIVDNIGKSFTEVDIPSDINVLSHSEGAIDPYTFLDLPR